MQIKSDFIKLFVRHLILFLGRLCVLLLVHESTSFHVHSLDPVNHGHLVNHGLRGQLSSPFCVFLVFREALGEPKLVDFTSAAEGVLLLDPNLGALIPSHVLHTFPEALWPGDITDVKLNGAASVVWARIEDGLVIEVGNVLDFAQPAEQRLALAFT